MNQQLLDYIKEQLVAGADKGSIRSTLLSAGWPEKDVDDAFATVNSGSATGSTADTVATSTQADSPAGQAQPEKPAEPEKQMASRPASITPKTQEATPAKASMDSPGSVVVNPTAMSTENSNAPYSSMLSDSEKAPKRSLPISTIILSAVIVLLVAGGVLFYFLIHRGVVEDSLVLESRVTQLTSDVSALTSSNSEIESNLSSVMAENESLKSELLFVATPEGTSNTPITTDVTGEINQATSGAFFLTTNHGIRVDVANSFEDEVVAILEPLVGGNITLTGTHAPGSNDLTVSQVNGTPIVFESDATNNTDTSTDEESEE